MYSVFTARTTGNFPSHWKQLIPRCAHPECATGSRWSGVLHRVTGFWLNDQQWFCSPRCLEESLHDLLLGYFFEERRPAPIRTAMPLGLMMLSRGVISDPQLRDAIAMQRSSGEKIGACLQRLGCVSYDDIASAVATQWGCPLFPAESVQPGCSMLVPFSLIERYRMSPVHLVSQGRRLFVGFSDKVNRTALIGIQHMLGCETEACIIPEPKFLQVLEYRKRDTTGEIAVSRPRLRRRNLPHDPQLRPADRCRSHSPPCHGRQHLGPLPLPAFPPRPRLRGPINLRYISQFDASEVAHIRPPLANVGKQSPHLSEPLPFNFETLKPMKL